jgi:tetratricopeptide (TPR) repeat protein
MRIILTYILIIFLAIPFYGQQVNQIQQSRNKAQQAAIFFRDNEFEKARDLYLELYKDTRLSHYFDNYINSLVSLKEYEEAEKALQKEIRSNNNLNLEITLGYVYKEMGDLQKSSVTFNKVLDKLPANRGIIINVGNTFFNRREFEFAEKTYLKGRMLIPGEMFRNNLAAIYSFMRDYERMMAEYLEMVKEDENEVQRIQARVNSLLRFDFDNSLRSTFRREIIKAIQNNPNVIAYNRLLIWMFITEKNYEQALNNTIALDRRTKEEDANILNFARGAAQEELFDVALKGLKYLSGRTPIATNAEEVAREIVNIEFQKYTSLPVSMRPPENEMELLFRELINEQGYTKSTVSILQKYAHFLSFYKGKPNLAYEVLENALGISGLSNNERSILRIEMADTYVFDNKLWEASLLYSRIAEANQGNAFADNVKLKRAKLSFYLGDVEWAKIQLDALKASTSKLIANDAMELSLLIATHYDMDTIAEPVQMFARGDLLLFQNRDSLAYTVFDSVAAQFPYHTINDMVLMRKAAISEKEHNFEQAATYYRQIVENFSSSNSADVALYKLALLYEEELGMPDEAQENYRKVMINYPGSIYTNDSRNRYRKLRGDFDKEETITPYESENYYSRPE